MLEYTYFKLNERPQHDKEGHANGDDKVEKLPQWSTTLPKKNKRWQHRIITAHWLHCEQCIYTSYAFTYHNIGERSNVVIAASVFVRPCVSHNELEKWHFNQRQPYKRDLLINKKITPVVIKWPQKWGQTETHHSSASRKSKYQWFITRGSRDVRWTHTSEMVCCYLLQASILSSHCTFSFTLVFG